jgi:hypothetical protein
MNIQNHRQAGESAVEYRQRRRTVAKLLRAYLRKGVPATHSRELDSDGKPRAYINGPHRSHKPHEVKKGGFVLGPAGVPRPHIWTVTHPGTLVKQ